MKSCMQRKLESYCGCVDSEVTSSSANYLRCVSSNVTQGTALNDAFELGDNYEMEVQL